MFNFYKCRACGEEFAETGDYREEHEIHTEVVGMNVQTYYVPLCPRCGSDYIEEGYRCSMCEEKWTDSMFCADCFEEVTDMVKELGNRHAQSYKMTTELIEEWINLHW